MRNIKNIIKEELEDYRGYHTAPSPQSDDSPMYDVTDKFGEDIYGRDAVRLFGGYGAYDSYSVALIQRARNKPNMQVKIYRAVPKVITNQEKINDYEKQKAYILKTGRLPQGIDNWKNSSEYYDWLSDEVDRLKSLPQEQEAKVKINSGDWVTINPAYAREHGISNLNNKFRVLTKTVPAKQLYTDGNSIHEWGYVENAGVNELSDTKKVYDTIWEELNNLEERKRKRTKGMALPIGQIFSMGLNENTYKVYHGTNNQFDKFDFNRATQGIVWFTDSIDSIKKGEHGGQGSKYIMTRYITINNPAGWEEYEKYGLQQLEDMGYDGVILPQGDKTDYFVFSNKSIRKAAPKPVKEEKNQSGNKLYYHGRTQNRPYAGKYIYITDSLGYAAGYSDGKELYVYTLPFGENKLFSIKNPMHLRLLNQYIDDYTLSMIFKSSGRNEEIDWAALSYISTDEFENPEDLFEHLGFYGIRLKERAGIDSIYVFDEKYLTPEGTIDITTPENQEKIRQFYKDFTKDKNFLEEEK